MRNNLSPFWRTIILVALATLTIALFVADFIFGATDIALSDVWAVLTGNSQDPAIRYILLEMRIPKAIAAALTGAGMAVTGLMMQTIFRNPLADTSILGVSSGAALGVGIYVMAGSALGSILPFSIGTSYWGMIIASMIGAGLVLAIISWSASRLQNMLSVLIIGVMTGFLASSAVNLLQYFADPDIVKSYLIWTFGSLQSVSWIQLYILIPVISVALFLSALLSKSMNAMLLGEGYARTVGIRVNRVQTSVILITSLIVGALTAFVGPISFIGIAVPHLARLIFGTTNHHFLVPATIIIGILFMLGCDILTLLPGGGVVLPINAVTSLFGAPIVIYIIVRNRKGISL